MLGEQAHETGGTNEADEGSRFEVFGTLNPELRIAHFSRVSRFTRHGLWPLAGFSSILLDVVARLDQDG